MKRITTNLIVDIDDDVFEDEFDSDEGRVLLWALEHGDAGGEFEAYWTVKAVVEDVEENA
ncbi:hypothetical protein SEA_IBANTIK_28 [Streptomyces phage Ibantik]|uniref:Uncharacterized protein n=1 Tax=Streptomyces phage Ibantik TaxID=2182397 RepID=A0A2U8UNP3_9CAUD|nr:hypothetical protein QEH36_gp028 [Streptomyces phage Ibantik]AWN05252.1 hypothetical protein SEA_IBANTIK_28 [Streptomyces phage Ibantik]